MKADVLGWRRWFWPLVSRKVQVAVATVVAAYTSQVGFELSEETVATVLAVGVALISGNRRTRTPVAGIADRRSNTPSEPIRRAGYSCSARRFHSASVSSSSLVSVSNSSRSWEMPSASW